MQPMSRCTPRDKFLLTFVILKLNLLPRIGKSAKCLIFVNSVERCFKLKLFLEQFGVKSCVLNGEMPGNTRYELWFIFFCVFGFLSLYPFFITN